MTDHAAQVELAQLRAEVAAMRQELAALRSTGAGVSGPSGSSAPVNEVMSRRGLLLKAGGVTAAAAVAAVGITAATATPAAATTGTMVYGTIMDAGADTTSLLSSDTFATLNCGNDASGSGVLSQTKNGPAVFGNSAYSNGVQGFAIGQENGFNGVYGKCQGTGNGVYGESTTGNALLGIASGKGNSVFGYKDTGVAGDAVVGYTKAAGRGVVGISGLGRGGVFTGKTAQVQMTPGATTSHPASGQAGDFFVDSTKRLWFCKGGTTWKQLA